MDPHQVGQTGEIAALLLRCHLMEKELAATSALSVDEFHLIVQLYLKGPLCVKTVREQLRLDPSRLSRLLHDLEERGYLTRSLDALDKRKERLDLTDEGARIAWGLLLSSRHSVLQLAGSVTKELAHILTSPDPITAAEANPEVTIS